MTFVLPFLVLEPELVEVPCEIVQKVVVGVVVYFPVLDILIAENLADGGPVPPSVENLYFLK